MPKRKTDPITDHQRVATLKTMSSEKALQYDMMQKRKDWLDPIGMSQLKRAVERKSKKAVIHGIEYAVTYGVHFKSKLGHDATECVKLKRTDGQRAPFGYVSIKRILAFEFEAGKG